MNLWSPADSDLNKEIVLLWKYLEGSKIFSIFFTRPVLLAFLLLRLIIFYFFVDFNLIS